MTNLSPRRRSLPPKVGGDTPYLTMVEPDRVDLNAQLAEQAQRDIPQPSRTGVGFMMLVVAFIMLLLATGGRL